MSDYIIIYFSGTGNTMYIAQRLSSDIGCKAFSIEDSFNIKSELKDKNKLILCFPIYFSVAPFLMKQFIINNNELLKNKKFILLATQQFFSGDGALSIKSSLPDSAEIIYAEHFNMPANIGNIPFYSVLTKGNFDKSAQKADKKIKKIITDLNNGVVRIKGATLLGKFLGKTQNTHEKKFLATKRDSIKVKDTCIQCGKCTKMCPSGNLLLNEKKIRSNNSCIFCYRCVNICPEQAITTLLHGKVEFQYYVTEKVKNQFTH